jgi:hypothetical protein
LVVAAVVEAVVALINFIIVEQCYMLVAVEVLVVEQVLRLYLLVEEYEEVCSNVVHLVTHNLQMEKTDSHNNQDILQQIHGLAGHLYLVAADFHMDQHTE